MTVAPDDYIHVRDPSLNWSSSPVSAASKVKGEVTQAAENMNENNRESSFPVASPDLERQKPDKYDRPPPPPPNSGW